MKPLDLREYAERLRLIGDDQEQDFADEILMLAEIEQDVAEPYFELCENLKYYAPGKEPAKAVEWLGDRSDLLTEIGDELKKHGYDGDVDDEVKGLIDALGDVETALRKSGHWTEGDMLDALYDLLEKVPVHYDL